MSLGFVMVNFAPAKTKGVFPLVDKYTPPIYVLFFVLVGAKLNIWIITPFLGLIAIIYVLGRTLGKSKESQKYRGKCLPTVAKSPLRFHQSAE